MSTTADPGRPPAIDPRFEELIGTLGPDAGAFVYLEELRWPDGVCCVRCLSARVGFLAAREKHHCRDCGYQFRVTAGTAFHDSHAPPAKWLIAVQCMLQSGDGFPANQLQTVIGGSYKTSWFIEHRIRHAMAQALGRAERTVRIAVTNGEPLDKGPAFLEASAAAELAPVGVARSLGVIEQAFRRAYRRPSPDHWNAYAAEARWRATQDGRHEGFRRTILALLEANPVTYEELTRPRRSRGAVRRARSAEKTGGAENTLIA